MPSIVHSTRPLKTLFVECNSRKQLCVMSAFRNFVNCIPVPGYSESSRDVIDGT